MQANTPYSFDLFYQVHARYPHPSLFTLRDGAYYRAFQTDSDPGLLKVTSDNNGYRIVALIGEAPLEKIQHVIGADSNLSDFYVAAKDDVALQAIIKPLIGLPLYCNENLYEALIFVIIEQHIAWVNAQKAQKVLVEWGDNYIEYEGDKYYVMPPPEQLSKATIDDLRPTKITFKRMQLLIDIAQRFVDEPDFMYFDRRVSPQELYDELLKIKGIGHWTASVVVSRATGVYPFVPHNDVALQAAVAEYFDVEKSAEATKTVFAEYGNYAGLAAHFTLMKWVLDKYPVVNG